MQNDHDKHHTINTSILLFILDGETWICKPTGMNQGKGIYLVSSKEQLMEKLNMNGGNDSSTRRSQVRPPQGRVIQRYMIISSHWGYSRLYAVFISRLA